MSAAIIVMLGCGGVLYTTMQRHETEQPCASTSLDLAEKSERIEIAEEASGLKEEEYHRDTVEVSRGSDRRMRVKVTAYDLSVESCGIPPGGNGYGITASGVDLSGHSLESARAIAVDPDVIPLGSEVRVSFDDPEWQHLDGYYKAVDTGSAVNGHHIDLFFGDSGSYYPDPVLDEFGVRHATIEMD